MPRVTVVTDADCDCVCAQMPPISCASSRETRPISSSARPATSDRRAPRRRRRWKSPSPRRVLRVGLDRLDDRLDLPRRLGRALGQPLDLLGHDGEAAARLARRRGLDRGVEREHVRPLGDVGDELDDLADLQRRLAEPLDPLRRVLDLPADVVHAGDLALHRAGAVLGRRERLLGDPRRARRRLRDLVDRRRHLQRRSGHLPDLPALALRRLVQAVGDRGAAAVARVTSSVAELMRMTSVRSSSTAKLIESAMAPVTSSVTEAFTVRSPSARSPSRSAAGGSRPGCAGSRARSARHGSWRRRAAPCRAAAAPPAPRPRR